MAAPGLAPCHPPPGRLHRHRHKEAVGVPQPPGRGMDAVTNLRVWASPRRLGNQTETSFVPPPEVGQEEEGRGRRQKKKRAPEASLAPTASPPPPQTCTPQDTEHTRSRHSAQKLTQTRSTGVQPHNPRPQEHMLLSWQAPETGQRELGTQEGPACPEPQLLPRERGPRKWPGRLCGVSGRGGSSLKRGLAQRKP